MNGQFEQRQKNIETQKAEYISSLEARRSFWEEVSKTILTYETLALDVSWFQTSLARNDEMHRRAFERYNDRIVELTANWRVLISRASTLSSQQVADDLHSFLAEVFTKQDTPIIQLTTKKALTADWDKQHSQSEKVLARANKLIAKIAVEMELSPKK